VRAVPATLPPIPEDPEPQPALARSVAPPESPAPPGAWSGLLVQLAVVALSWLRPGHAVPPPPQTSSGVQHPVAPPPARPTARTPSDGEASLDRGLRDIQRTDPGFDPSRFIGYAGMMFRAAQAAWMARDIGAVRDRLTPELHDALQAQCDQLRSGGRVNRIEEIEITAAVTEAWQEDGRDYVTAHVSGSLVDYTIDEARDSAVVDGSRTRPRPVEEFWTFTRPVGLNFWMLAAIQT
jgi:predicted lipid-binding transport protein (Tim44 family)